MESTFHLYMLLITLHFLPILCWSIHFYWEHIKHCSCRNPNEYTSTLAPANKIQQKYNLKILESYENFNTIKNTFKGITLSQTWMNYMKKATKMDSEWGYFSHIYSIRYPWYEQLLVGEFWRDVERHLLREAPLVTRYYRQATVL